MGPQGERGGSRGYGRGWSRIALESGGAWGLRGVCVALPWAERGKWAIAAGFMGVAHLGYRGSGGVLRSHCTRGLSPWRGCQWAAHVRRKAPALLPRLSALGRLEAIRRDRPRSLAGPLRR